MLSHEPDYLKIRQEQVEKNDDIYRVTRVTHEEEALAQLLSRTVEPAETSSQPVTELHISNRKRNAVERIVCHVMTRIGLH